MNLAKSFILIVGDDGVLLIPPRNTRAEPLFISGHEGNQTDYILEALAERPRAPVLIFADTLAQEFRRDTHPRLNRFDRAKLLAKRLQQNFPPPQNPASFQLSVAWPQKNNAALFACLYENSPVSTWLKRLMPLSNPSGFVSLLPFESASMIAKLCPEAKQGWGLLLSCQRTGGYRQIVTYNGELIFSRLTPPLPPLPDDKETVTTLAQDIQASRSYLARFGLTDAMHLPIIAIMPERMHKDLFFLKLQSCTVKTFTPHQAAKHLGLAFAPSVDDPASDVLHAAWLIQKNKPSAILMAPEIRRKQGVSRLKSWGQGVTTLLWLFTLAFVGWQGHDLWSLGTGNLETQKTVATLEKKLADERIALAPDTERLGRLQQAVERQRLFSAPMPLPWDLLKSIARVQEKTAQAVRFDWKDEPETLIITLRLTHVEKRTGPKEITRRAITKSFDQLAQALRRKIPGFDVKIARYPFPAQPNETLSNAAEKADAPPDAEFIFRKEAP